MNKNQIRKYIRQYVLQKYTSKKVLVQQVQYIGTSGGKHYDVKAVSYPSIDNNYYLSVTFDKMNYTHYGPFKSKQQMQTYVRNDKQFKNKKIVLYKACIPQKIPPSYQCPAL